jgi:bifunctional non-homologous end joining protein LigD
MMPTASSSDYSSMLSCLAKALKPLHVNRCPFVDLPNPKSSRWGGGVTPDEMREMQWVRPKLVAQIRFVEWTAEGRLRHAAFLGLRADKSAREVRREAHKVTS